MFRRSRARRPRSVVRPRLARGSADRSAYVLAETIGSRAPDPGSRLSVVASILVLDERFSAPVALFDLFDLFLAQSEVVSDLVNERFADDRAHFILVFAILFDGSLKERDAVGELI